jgi:hypothetical protein
MRVTSITRPVKRGWVPLVVLAAVALAAAGVMRLHGIFGSKDPNAAYGGAVKIVEFNPKNVLYEIFGPAGTVAAINYWDADANTHQVNGVVLPWSYTITTTLPSVSGNIVARGDSNSIGCRITVDGVVQEEKRVDGLNAQVFCLVKSA